MIRAYCDAAAPAGSAAGADQGALQQPEEAANHCHQCALATILRVAGPEGGVAPGRFDVVPAFFI